MYICVTPTLNYLIFVAIRLLPVVDGPGTVYLSVHQVSTSKSKCQQLKLSHNVIQENV